MNRQKFQLNGLSVIYEDNHLIAINKPAGALVHGDETGDTTLSDLVKEYIKIRYGKPGDVFLGVIHRLDRPVSGVVIFARTSKALERMNKMLREHTMEKTYLAIVAVRPEEFSGRLVHHLIKDEQKNITRAYASKKTGTKEAILEYHLVGELDAKVLLEVHPITGRPHQIRTQLSKIGSPIIGDLKYGAEYPLHDKSIALHCYKMAFVHPVKNEKVVIKADPPSLAIWRTFTID
jgi:23S rRNA pseudouridine1911/1915/1917 synthase